MNAPLMIAKTMVKAKPVAGSQSAKTEMVQISVEKNAIFSLP